MPALFLLSMLPSLKHNQCQSNPAHEQSSSGEMQPIQMKNATSPPQKAALTKPKAQIFH